jgi:hypothetical protein
MAKRGRKLGGKNSKKKYDTPPSHRVCPRCKRNLPATEYAKVPARPSGLDCYWQRRLKKDGAMKFLEYIQYQQLIVQEMQETLAEWNRQQNTVLNSEPSTVQEDIL